MITQLEPDTGIPVQIYQLASKHNVGTPLKRLKRVLLQVMVISFLLLFLGIVGLLCYDVYGYFAFESLAHIYPDIFTVPPGQLDNYIWLQGLHDDFGANMLQLSLILLSILSSFLAIYASYTTKIYLCTDGLLKIYKQKDEAVRWDEVKETCTKRGKVIKLVRRDGSNLELPILLMAFGPKSPNAFIEGEVTGRLLPDMLASYERGEEVAFGRIKVAHEGIYKSAELIHWDELGDIALEKGQLSLYYKGKWHIWEQGSPQWNSLPNLPSLVALVRAILDRLDAEHRPFS